MSLRLTRTERRVVELLVKEHRSYVTAAKALDCAPETVRWHVKRIIDRMPPHALPALARLRLYFGGYLHQKSA